MKQFPIILFITITLSVNAQTESTDTLSISKNITPATTPQQETTTIPHSPTYEYTPGHNTNNAQGANFTTKTFPGIHLTPGAANILDWKNGGIFVTGSAQTLQGLMNIQNGSINAYQQIGKLKIDIFGEATKYGYYRGLSTTYGYGGSLSYNINDHLSITTFGTYTTTPGFMTPGMAGYINTTNFGGYINYRINDHWGVKTGVHTYKSIMNNSWQTQPMVTPYFRLSNGQEIGIDIGSILYNLLINIHSGSFRGNPTIAPPTMQDMH